MLHSSKSKDNTGNKTMKEMKLTRRQLRGCEPGQDSQPPNPPKQKTKKKHTTTKKRGMAAKHLRQELLSEYHDVQTSGLTFYEHPNDPYIQPASHVLQKKPLGGG